MNNTVEYKDLMAFHPGYYIAEVIEDMGVSQAEFAQRLGTTPKTISTLVNGQISLSEDLAKKLSAMFGTGVEVWLNLQMSYDKKIIEIEREKELDEQIEIMSMIDYPFFVKVAKLPYTRDAHEKIANLCRYFKISDLRILSQPDFLVNYRSGISNIQPKNVVNSRAWIQTAINFAEDIETQPFSADRLKMYLPEIRKMTLQDPAVFLPRMQEIFAECGVAFVLIPSLKNAGVNGAVKWVNNNRVILAMNNRGVDADKFWFSLFHEIGHIFQQKIKAIFINSSVSEMKVMDSKCEESADAFATDYLISPKDYKRFAPTQFTSDAEIIEFAKSIGIHPGIVAGRLQHDKIIPQSRCSKMKVKYSTIYDGQLYTAV